MNTIHDMGGTAAYGHKNKTEGWQPIYYGHVGACLKTIAKGCWDEFLDASTLEVGKKNFEVCRRARRVPATSALQ